MAPQQQGARRRRRSPTSGSAALGRLPAVAKLHRAVACLWGHTLWVLVMAVGVLLCAPVAVLLAWKLVTRPRQMLRRKDRSRVRYPDPLPGLVHQWVETAPGIKLHVVRTESGSGKPLMLLVHGFPEFWFSWRRQMEAFRGSHEVVAVDLRGYGESSKPQGRAANRMEALTGDITSLARHLLAESAGQRQLVLAGHNWGGVLAWCAAHSAPELFSRLVVVCAPHPSCFLSSVLRLLLDWDQARRSWYMIAFQCPLLPEAFFRGDDYEAVGGALREPLVPAGVFGEEDIERYKQAMGRPGALSAGLTQYRAQLDMWTGRRPLAPGLHRALCTRLDVPTLVLWGEHDHALGPQLLRGLDQHAARLRVEVLAGGHHHVQLERPAEVNRHMRDFLGDT